MMDSTSQLEDKRWTQPVRALHDNGTLVVSLTMNTLPDTIIVDIIMEKAIVHMLYLWFSKVVSKEPLRHPQYRLSPKTPVTE